jgi:hypothetical protein
VTGANKDSSLLRHRTNYDRENILYSPREVIEQLANVEHQQTDKSWSALYEPQILLYKCENLVNSLLIKVMTVLAFSNFKQLLVSMTSAKQCQSLYSSTPTLSIEQHGFRII